MSTLTGHGRITAQALRELQRANPGDPLFRGLAEAGIPGNVVARDLFDVILLGHWADYGQKHHFMRRFDGQSPFQALQEGAAWVRSNALSAASRLARRISAVGPTSGAVAGTWRSGAAADRPNWQDLGNALHATQDSFARGHVEREAPRGGAPGPIIYIKKYGGADREGHEHFDDLWWDERRSDFSADGRFAVEASKGLIMMVVTTAVRAGRGAVHQLDGWDAYRARWFAASDRLSRRRDFGVDFVERFRTGPRMGASSVTFSMDEDGMARALYDEVGADMARVHEVFRELDEHHNTDADDVAEIYVNILKRSGGPPLAALRRNEGLKALLIRVMDEGWTSSGESECIRFLQGL
jgi:hypothetical protein